MYMNTNTYLKMLLRYSDKTRQAICKRIEDAFLVRKQPMGEFFDKTTDDASVHDIITTFEFIRVMSVSTGGVNGDATFTQAAPRYVRVNDSLFSAEFQRAAAFYEQTLCLVFLVRDGRVFPRISVATITKVCGRRQIAKRLCAMANNTLASAAERAQAYECLVSFVEFYKTIANDTETYYPPQMKQTSGLEIWDIGCLKEKQRAILAEKTDLWHSPPTRSSSSNPPALLSF